jgi:hypothetical protein
MEPGELRRFKDFKRGWSLSKAYFVVVVDHAASEGWARRVDILIDGRVETMDYFWVMDSSETLNEAG